MRDAAYEGLSFKRRKELHGRAARAIETRTTTPDEGAELLSLHWLHAEGYDQAWHYSRLAGERARVLWANAEAATFYARALEAANRLRTLPRSDVSAVAEALGDACELTGNYERSRRAYAQARRLVGDEVDRARLLRKTGVLHERHGRYRQALACTRGAAGSSSARPQLLRPSGRSSILRRRASGRARVATGSARALPQRQAVEAARAGHRSGLAHALYLEHMMSVYLGQPEDDLAFRALAIFEELGDLVGQGNVLNNLGIGAYYRGKWVTSLEHYERSREARVRSGDVVGAATEENNIAEILSDQGDLEAARSLFESARATWLAAGYRVGAALATSNLGRLEARAGNVARGRELLEEALGRLPRDPLADLRRRNAGSPRRVPGARRRLHGGHCLVPRAAGRASGDGPGLEQVELTTLRLLGTPPASPASPEGPGGRSAASSQALDEAIERATALEAPYELALALAARSVLDLLIDGARPSRYEDTHERRRPITNAPRPSSTASALPGRSSPGQARSPVS